MRPTVTARISHVILAALLGAALATASLAAEGDLPPDVVARVYGREIRESDVHQRLARRFEGTQRGVDALEQMIEDLCVLHEAARREVVVTDDDTRDYLAKIDAKLRRDTQGLKSLADVYKEQETDEAEFLDVIRDFLLRQRMAKEDMGASATQGASQFGIEGDLPIHRMKLWLKSLRARHEVVTEGLPDGVLATVDGVQITRATYASSVADRLPAEIVAGFRSDLVFEAAVEKHLADAGLSLGDDHLKSEIVRLRARFDDDPRVAGSGITFDQFLRQSTGAGESELSRDPSFRARLGLRLLLADKVTPERIRQHWEENREAYGEQALLRAVFQPARSGSTGLADDRLPTFEEASEKMLRAKVEILRLSGQAGALEAGTKAMSTAEAVTAVAKAMADNDERRRVAGEPEVWTHARVASEGELSRRVFEGEIGTVQGPLRSSVGYYLVLVEQRRPAPKFEELTDKLTEDVLRIDQLEWRRAIQSDPDVVLRESPGARRGRR